MTFVRLRFFSLQKLYFLILALLLLLCCTSQTWAQLKTQTDIRNEGCSLVSGITTKDSKWSCTSGATYECQSGLCSSTGTLKGELDKVDSNIKKEYDASCKKTYGESSYVDSTGKCFDPTQSVCTTNFNLMACLSWLADMIVGNIVSLINRILAWILSIAMYLLDLVIYITVVKFTDNFANLNIVSTNLLPTSGPNSTLGEVLFGPERGGLIYYIWGMLRDFVNLLLLITIIYYAVHTMFQGFNAHRDKFLYLLIFSIVINFSLFFVKFAIDLSNILSLQAYTLMANPQSFETWEGFRSNASRGGIITPDATLGDYLLNIASIGGAHKVSVAKDAAEQRINEGMKASWVYQILVMLMYIGLIYIVFFLAGLLVMRAAAFLFAMLLAALLAADIFFSTFSIDNKDFMDGIRGATDKIKNDFYEALIKGPVLFLFLFLVGILSNAIFNQSLQAEITSISSGSEEFKVFGNAFAASLAIFLKFALFFALTKVLFDKLNTIGPKGKWLGGGAKTISNWAMRQTVGRGAGAAAYAGRELIGRRLAGGKIGQSLQNQFTSMQESKSTFGRIIGNRIGRLGNRAVAGVKDSSMDVRASKRVQTLASNIAGAVFKDKDGKPIKINGEDVFGKSAKDKDGKGGYEALDAQAVADANTELSEYIKTAQSGVKISDADVKSEIKLPGKDKIDFGGGKFNADDITKITNDISTRPTGTAGYTYKGVSFDGKDSLFTKDRTTGLSAADVAIINSNKKLEEEKKKLQKKRESEVETKIRANVSTREGPGFTERAFDERTGATLSDENREKLAKQMEDKADADVAKKNKEAREFAGKVTAVGEFSKDVESALGEVENALELNRIGAIVLSPAEVSSLGTLKTDLETAKRSIPTGKISADDLKNFTNNSSLHDNAYKTKREAALALQGIYEKGKAASAALVAARGDASDEYEALKKASPPATAGIPALKAYERGVRAAKEKLDFIDAAMKTAYNNAQKIEDRIGPSIEKLEKLKTKPDEKKP